MTGVVAVQIGASRRYDGPSGKSDRAFLFGALSLAFGLGAPVGPWIEVVLGVMIAEAVHQFDQTPGMLVPSMEDDHRAVGRPTRKPGANVCSVAAAIPNAAYRGAWLESRMRQDTKGTKRT